MDGHAVATDSVILLEQGEVEAFARMQKELERAECSRKRTALDTRVARERSSRKHG
jgi:hypothetical protein